MMETEHKHFDVLGSTAEWAKRHAKELNPDKLTVITTGYQTGGKGQFGKKWASPEGNLYATYCFVVPTGFEALPHAAQLIAWSVAQVLMEMGLEPKFKWPNDILINGKKISGALVETETFVKETFVFASTGLNINANVQVDQPTTSLADELGMPQDHEAIFRRVTHQVEEDVEVYLEEGFHPFVQPFEELLV